MRCFIAIPVPESVRNRLWELTESFRSAFLHDSSVRISWVRPHGMHVTLAFLGELNETELTAIRSVLTATPISIPAFDISLTGLDSFPARGTPRVVFMGILAGKQEIVKLEADMRNRLAGLWEPDREEFSPHITIGRIKKGSAAIRKEIVLSAVDGTFTADRVVLFESRLHPEGPEYIPLETVRLAEREA